MATKRAPAALVAAGCAAAVLSFPLVLVSGIGLLAGGGSSNQPDVPVTATAGIPDRAAAAYRRSAARCPGLDWTLLAAIGAVETRHGQVGGAGVDPDTGEALPWIFGPPLDGNAGTTAIPIGRWTGWWGLTGPWTQAVGPMQFLPATFDEHAVDADDDGVASPHDIDDAVATTAAYLCAASDGQVSDTRDVARIYNPGDPSYADQLASERQRILSAAQQPPPDEVAGTASATVCPVVGNVEFTDTFGAARSGGRRHQGVDIFAPVGTPVVAPAAGTLEHYDNQLGGLSYRLYGDDGTYYYGTHLSAYENVGAGHVIAGTTIGYVGNTGNAATTPAHLHWEIHPTGQGTPAINPTPTADALCG